jgi:hypothetical protein
MNRDSVLNMIDKKIVASLVEGHSIRYIQQELDDKMHKFAGNIKDSDKNIDLLKLLSMDVNTISPTRTRYQVIYIKECGKRIKDLDWLLKNKYKFPKLSSSQVFNLIKLREKLSEENAIPF